MIRDSIAKFVCNYTIEAEGFGDRYTVLPISHSLSAPNAFDRLP